MPRVPMYGNRQVGLSPLPGVRKQAGETALSQGAGVAAAEGQVGQAIEQLGATGNQVASHWSEQLAYEAHAARETADNTALLEASNKLSSWSNQKLYDPNDGVLARKGKDAMGAPEQTLDEFNTKADEVADSLTTDKQRQAFQKVRADHQQSLDLTVRRHTLGEMQTYQAGELKAYVENAQTAAVQNALDPTRISQEVGKGVSALKLQGPGLGLGPEEVQGAVEKFTSGVHVGVIDRLLSLDKAKAAAVYFDETKGQIDGDAQTRIIKALDDASMRGDAQKKSDEIIGAGGTLTEQREKARQIEEPKLRDEVMTRIEHEAAINEKIDRDREENALLGAYNIVDQTHDVAKIPTNAWTQLSGTSRSGLRSYAEHLAKGVPLETDLPTYYNLMTMAGTAPENFATTNLLNYRAKLGDTEFKQLAGLQLSIRSADSKKTEKALAPFMTNRQVVENTLPLFGIETSEAKQTPDQKRAIAQLYRMIDNRVGAFQNLTGKEPSNDDVQHMLDDVLSQQVTVPGSWWNIFPGGKPFFDQSTRVIDFKVGDIPASERTLIEQALRSAGRPVSDATVLDLYIEHHARKGK